MNNCIGMMGKIFGHDFQQYLIEKNPSGSIKLDQVTVWGNQKDPLPNLIDSIAHTKYKIVCKRCGVEYEK